MRAHTALHTLHTTLHSRLTKLLLVLGSELLLLGRLLRLLLNGRAPNIVKCISGFELHNIGLWLRLSCWGRLLLVYLILFHASQIEQTTKGVLLHGWGLLLLRLLWLRLRLSLRCRCAEWVERCLRCLRWGLSWCNTHT